MCSGAHASCANDWVQIQWFFFFQSMFFCFVSNSQGFYRGQTFQDSLALEWWQDPFSLQNSDFNVFSGRSTLKNQYAFGSGIYPSNGKIFGNSIAIKFLRNKVTDWLDCVKYLLSPLILLNFLCYVNLISFYLKLNSDCLYVLLFSALKN